MSAPSRFRRTSRPAEMAHTTSARALVTPAALTMAVIATQIVYPLTGEPARARLTMLCVAVFFLASVSHALVVRGRRFTATLVAVTAGGGLLVEAVGVATGFPFGRYAYGSALAPQLFGVPWVIPLAWTMMAYPALIAARLVTPHPVRGPLLAAVALASWDLFLDPQMIDAGYWTWGSSTATFVGVPLSNFAGWAVTALVMMLLLWPLVAVPPAWPADAVPLALYLWTYVGSVVAHGVFLGLRDSAVAGGLVMGAVVVVVVANLRRLLHSS